MSVTEYIDANVTGSVSLLAEAVAIKSVSAHAQKRDEVIKMAHWIKEQILSSVPGSNIWLEEITKKQTFSDGTEAPYPPLVMGNVGPLSNSKRTLLIYAHYDVQPAEEEDGWDTDPWKLTDMNGQLRARGSTDDKGPLVGWLCVFKAYSSLGIPLPVNIKICLEGMEESGSEGFDETVAKHKEKHPQWWEQCDWCVVSDNYWLGTCKPCLSYGLRGVTCCELTIEGPSSDLHSGVFGGAVFQPLDDLMYVMNNLKDKSGECMIPGIMDDVAPVTAEERAMYEKLTFSVEEFCHQVGCTKLRSMDKTQVLMDRWRNPSVTLHGIEGAYSEPGFKTVIPRKVAGKFSIRTVPYQTLAGVEKCIREYVDHLMAERVKAGQTCNSYSLSVEGGPWFYVDPLKSPVFKAAHKAIVDIWSCEPDYTREGGSIPVTVTLSKLTGRDLCLIPMGRSDDGAHSQNEKLDLENFVKGMKVFVKFLEHLSDC